MKRITIDVDDRVYNDFEIWFARALDEGVVLFYGYPATIVSVEDVIEEATS